MLTSGDILLGGRSVLEREPERAAARDRLRDPADRAVPAPDGAPTTSRPCRGCSVGSESAIAGACQRAARADRPRSRGDRTRATRHSCPAASASASASRARSPRIPPLMLMDEPFGAIDPINRARLQDEFLRLQAQVRKTVVFVTHDIDEAIKMGDRIAILRQGGRLAQYDDPGGAADQPGGRLRGRVRRRRPGAQAARSLDAGRGRADRAERHSPGARPGAACTRRCATRSPSCWPRAARR